MDNIKDGGPAFPQLVRRPSFDSVEFETLGGMTLRDWFAGQALVGIMSTDGAFERADRRSEFVAVKAFEFADAMIAARTRATQEPTP
jgi:hypothetical protein